MMKGLEVLLLILAAAGVCIYLFYEADFLIYTALVCGIVYSILRWKRTHKQRKGEVLASPDVRNHSSFHSYDREFFDDDISSEDGDDT
ncbi:hypothetical protein [Halobacillus sp. KGW1]|uniref:hypothetical protein n=1 Tax=Halobacillus sp. KGW1 TaxID=1793726 RepID=UPI000781C0A5|nr:hypothetical protein [Halobacillus sp. KGW1]